MPTDLENTIQNLVTSVNELKQGIGFAWHDSIIVDNFILNNRNTIILPNNRLFLDLDSTSLLVFVNNLYVSPDKYSIINKNSFYFIYNDIIKLNDIINLIYLDKRSLNSNYDSRYLSLAKAWEYEYTNTSNSNINKITLDNKYSFDNTDKYSLLVYIDGLYISPIHYNIDNVRELSLLDSITLNINSTINIIQLSRVFPNEDYVGYLWGESLIADSDNNTFTISKSHSFISDDPNILVFVNGKISKDYNVIDTATIQFNNTISKDTEINIIQLGYIADIKKIREALDIETLKNLLDIDSDNFIKETQRNKKDGFVGLNKDGLIENNLYDVNNLAILIKNKFIENGWLPYNSERTNHIHNNMDVLWKLQLYNNKLYVNGYPVGDKAIEISYTVTLTQSMIENCCFDLPNDCDPDRPITLTINSVPQLHNNDWILIENDWPIPDQISWNNKELQNILSIGDICVVTYYKVVEKIQPPLPPSDSGYSHYHDNMRILEALSVNELNELCLNGVPVYEQQSIETNYQHIITNTDLTNKYIELPNDCDINKAIVVTINSVTLNNNIDYRILAFTYPELDRIDWKELRLESLISLDDVINVTYYKVL